MVKSLQFDTISLTLANSSTSLLCLEFVGTAHVLLPNTMQVAKVSLIYASQDQRCIFKWAFVYFFSFAVKEIKFLASNSPVDA